MKGTAKSKFMRRKVVREKEEDKANVVSSLMKKPPLFKDLDPADQRLLHRMREHENPLINIAKGDFHTLRLCLSQVWGNIYKKKTAAFKNYIRSLLTNPTQTKLHWQRFMGVSQYASRNSLRCVLNSVGYQWATDGIFVKCRVMDKSKSLAVRKYRDAIRIEALKGLEGLGKEYDEIVRENLKPTQMAALKLKETRRDKNHASLQDIAKARRAQERNEWVRQETCVGEEPEQPPPAEKQKKLRELGEEKKEVSIKVQEGTSFRKVCWGLSRSAKVFERPDPEEDLTNDGDVESNPGPPKRREKRGDVEGTASAPRKDRKRTKEFTEKSKAERAAFVKKEKEIRELKLELEAERLKNALTQEGVKKTTIAKPPDVVVKDMRTSVQRLPTQLQEGYSEEVTFSWVSGPNHLEVKDANIVPEGVLSWMIGDGTGIVGHPHPENPTLERLITLSEHVPICGRVFNACPETWTKSISLLSRAASGISNVLRSMEDSIPTGLAPAVPFKICLTLASIPMEIGSRVVSKVAEVIDYDLDRTIRDTCGYLEQEQRKGIHAQHPLEAIGGNGNTVPLAKCHFKNPRSEKDLAEERNGYRAWRVTITPMTVRIPTLDEDGDPLPREAGVDFHAHHEDVRLANIRKVELKANPAWGLMSVEYVDAIPGKGGFMEPHYHIRDRMVDMRGINMAYKGLSGKNLKEDIAVCVARRNMEYGINTHEEEPEEAADVVWAFTAKLAHQLSHNYLPMCALNGNAVRLSHGGSSGT